MFSKWFHIHNKSVRWSDATGERRLCKCGYREYRPLVKGAKWEPDRHWQEDFFFHNGRMRHICDTCGQSFKGKPKRKTCRHCVWKDN